MQTQCVSRFTPFVCWSTFVPNVPARPMFVRSSALLCHARYVPRARQRRRGVTMRQADKNEAIGDDDVLRSDEEIESVFARLRKVTETESSLSNKYGVTPSHQLVKFDEDGLADRERFVYVEEKDCIGCTHCQTTASGTFFMENDFGRARVFNQTGDAEALVEEAIDTCPVNCIYYCNWEDLVKLETARESQVINNWTRLVGGQDITSSKKTAQKTEVMDGGKMRCENCPGRGCLDCPLYGVGKNPEYLKKVQKAKLKRSEKKRRSDRRRL